jgi:hypothetical protein
MGWLKSPGSGVVIAASMALCACVVVHPIPVGAVGSGYGPVFPVPPGSGGGLLQIVMAETLPASGGTVTVSTGGATATVTVPNGSLADGGEIVITSGEACLLTVSSTTHVVVDFGVEAVNAKGLVINAPYLPPMTLTMTDPSITSGDSVVSYLFPDSSQPTASTTSTDRAVVTFSGPATFAVVASGSTSTCNNVPPALGVPQTAAAGTVRAAEGAKPTPKTTGGKKALATKKSTRGKKSARTTKSARKS